MMHSGRIIRLGAAFAVLCAVSFVARAVVAEGAEDRPGRVTRGLDYMHSRQADNGGFATPANTAWAVLAAVASGERMGASAWAPKGKNPFSYLQGTNHESAATSASVDNAPVYYARMIMAYTAVNRRERVFIAGTPHVDLLAKLYSYQDMEEDSPTRGGFSPSTSTRSFDAVHTTAWAVLAMYNFNTADGDRFTLARSWLAAQQKSGGGFPAEPGKSADCLSTALAIQALSAGSGGPTWDVAAARRFLKDHQNRDGGFPRATSGQTNAEATAAVIQAILALGERPEDSFWKPTSAGDGSNTPITALGALQIKNGAYKLSKNVRSRPVAVTSWALTALRRKSFAAYPRNIGAAAKAFLFRPQVRSASPKKGAKLKSQVVLIRATYTDLYPKGTGVNPKTSRLFVDGVNRSRPASIGRYGLRLLLKNVPNGSHTYKIELRDEAGNLKTIERRFTVAVPGPRPSSTPVPGGVRPAPVAPQAYPTHRATPRPYSTPSRPYSTPTPYQPSTPSPYPSPSMSESPIISGPPLPSPSASPSPAGAAATRHEGSAAGFVGGTLLAMLPIGAVASYLLLQHRREQLGAASQGRVLAGGGSAWERFKQTLARSKDLTRPSPRR